MRSSEIRLRKLKLRLRYNTLLTTRPTTVGQVVACVPVKQWAQVRSPVGTSFLGEVFSGFSSPIRQMSGSFRPPRSLNIIWPSLSSIIIHYRRQWAEMLMRPKTSNIHTYTNHRAPCIAIWQQPLQSVLALQSCIAMDFFFYEWVNNTISYYVITYCFFLSLLN